MIDAHEVNSIEELVRAVKTDYKNWGTKTFPWFRGEPEDYKDTALVPKVYRERKEGKLLHNENRLLQKFRKKAPSYAGSMVLRNEDNDQLLFLARHVGLPTRLLDWTEGLLAAVCFAVRDMKDNANGFVWMLEPVRLNNLSQIQRNPNLLFDPNDFPLTWFSDEKAYTRREDLLTVAKALAASGFEDLNSKWVTNRIGLANIRAAWELPADVSATDLPVAVHPTNVHVRLSAQKACFTIQGKRKEGLNKLVGSDILKKYLLPASELDHLKRDLRLLGVTSSTLFPDLDNLARDLADEDLLT